MAIGQQENKCPLHVPAQTSGEETLEDRSGIADDVEILLRPKLGHSRHWQDHAKIPSISFPGSCVQPLAPCALLLVRTRNLLQKTTLCGYT